MDQVNGAALERRQLRKLEIVSSLEASTLIVLVLVAVPLKHLAGLPVATQIMGPLHGLAFLIYFRTMIETVAGGGWSRAEIVQLAASAFIPFGGFANVRLIRRKSAGLS